MTCPVRLSPPVGADCRFSDWEMGACSTSCGGGVALWTREILREARDHGVCGETRKEVECNTQPCKVDCEWSHWEEVTLCTKECGGGVQTLSRNILRNVSGDGKPCTGKATTRIHCNEFICPGVVAAIVLPTLIAVLAILILGFKYNKTKYNILKNAEVSFNMRNIIKLPNRTS